MPTATAKRPRQPDKRPIQPTGAANAQEARSVLKEIKALRREPFYVGYHYATEHPLQFVRDSNELHRLAALYGAQAFDPMLRAFEAIEATLPFDVTSRQEDHTTAQRQAPRESRVVLDLLTGERASECVEWCMGSPQAFMEPRTVGDERKSFTATAGDPESVKGSEPRVDDDVRIENLTAQRIVRTDNIRVARSDSKGRTQPSRKRSSDKKL